MRTLACPSPRQSSRRLNASSQRPSRWGLRMGGDTGWRRGAGAASCFQGKRAGRKAVHTAWLQCSSVLHSSVESCCKRSWPVGRLQCLPMPCWVSAPSTAARAPSPSPPAEELWAPRGVRPGQGLRLVHPPAAQAGPAHGCGWQPVASGCAGQPHRQVKQPGQAGLGQAPLPGHARPVY